MRMPLKVRRIASLIAALVVGLALLEGYARLADAVGYGSQLMIEPRARDEEILATLRQGRSPFPRGTRSILVLGDSMAASLGIRREDVWSTLLGQQLRDKIDPRAMVVNAALPGANTYQELLMARELLPSLKPEVVLVMYNANDVYGTHDIITDPPPPPGAPIPPRPSPLPGPNPGRVSSDDVPIVLDSASSPVAKAIRFLKIHSRALNIFLPRFNIQLKARGYLMPGTEYHHMATRAYLDDFEGWKRTQTELSQLSELCARHRAKLIVYVLPEFDSLKYDHSAAIRRALVPYFARIGVPAVFGYDHFKDRSAEDLAISPFDGHPNAKANREIADEILAWLGKIGVFTRRELAER